MLTEENDRFERLAARARSEGATWGGEGFLCLWEERRGDGKWFGVFLRSEGIFSSLSIWL